MAGKILTQHWQGVVWWEKRRPAYNGLVLLAGIASLSLAVLIDHFSGRFLDIGSGFSLFFGILAYALGANACYTLGWITETAWGVSALPDLDRRRRRIFWIGVAFSVGLTFLPALVVLLLHLPDLRHAFAGAAG